MKPETECKNEKENENNEAEEKTETECEKENENENNETDTGNTIINFKQKLLLKDDIDKLTKLEKIEIFRIINQNQEKFTENKNMIMFDLNKCNSKTLENIQKLLNYSNDNKKELEKKDENCKIILSNLKNEN